MMNFREHRYNERSKTNLKFMPRKSNPEKDNAVSGAAPAKARHQATAARFRHSAASAEPPVSSVMGAETETADIVSVSGSTEPPREEIARLAYLYWLDRGCQDGSAEEDWFRAEQQLRQSSVTTH
jgi:hypothetical protein